VARPLDAPRSPADGGSTPAQVAPRRTSRVIRRAQQGLQALKGRPGLRADLSQRTDEESCDRLPGKYAAAGLQLPDRIPHQASCSGPSSLPPALGLDLTAATRRWGDQRAVSGTKGPWRVGLEMKELLEPHNLMV